MQDQDTTNPRPQPWSSFPVVDKDDFIEIRHLGEFVFDGMAFDVELEAFSPTEDGENLDDYDSHTADINLTVKSGDALLIYQNTDSRERFENALQEFMTATITGESAVSWGESGAQCAEDIHFGRNGW